MELSPRNRYLVIELENKNSENDKEKSPVLLPDNYKTQEEQFVTAKVLSTSPKSGDHPKSVAKSGQTIVAARHMIETISVKGYEFNIVLENHVIGVLRDKQ